MTITFERLFVGGVCRDEILGVKTKDIDMVAVPSTLEFDVDETFALLRADLVKDGFEIFTESPEHFTIRAHFPKGDPNFGRLTADFVLARKEGPYTDGRHPDWVAPGTLTDDILRRDCTVNAIAKTMDGEFIDLVGGIEDIRLRRLRFVGDPMQRLTEDSLRALRVIRFAITKGFTMTVDTFDAICDPSIPEKLSSVSTERKYEELNRCFKHDTLATLRLLNALPKEFNEAIFCNGLRLRVTLAK
jgi:tRNA nucleotidyltransferase/poly(A) polymerase